MKHLPKHLRPRWRYLAVGFETWPDATFNRRDFQAALWEAAQDLIGDAGSAAVDLTVLQFERTDGVGNAIVRTRRAETTRARAALACVSTVAGHAIGLRVRGTSGTVRACEEKYIRRRRESPEQRQVVFDSDDRRATVRNGAVDVRTDEGYSGATTLDLQ